MNFRLKNKKNHFLNQSGFTTIELIIAIQLSIIIISLVYVSYLFVSNLLEKWQNKIQIENHLNIISASITKNVTGISQIISASNKVMVAIKSNGDTIIYNLSSEFTQNDKILDSGILKFYQGDISYFFHQSEAKGDVQRRGWVHANERDLITGIQFSLQFHYKKKSYPLTILTRPLKLRSSIIKNTY